MQFNKNFFVQAIFLVGFLSGVFLILNKDIYIKNLGTSLEQNGVVVNSISVSGEAKVYVKPDMASITFSISELADNSKNALEKTNTKINQIIQILTSQGIDSKDIQTSQLSINPEYDYLVDRSVLKGQRATVSLSVKIKGIDNSATKASTVIDEVAKVENVQIGSIIFDLENKDSAIKDARAKAFEKAKVKATELSSLSSVNLLDPVSIVDNSSSIESTPILYSARSALAADSASGTSLSSGELAVSVSLQVIFGID